MSWTSPKTWTAGMALGAADYNAQIRDNLNYLFSPAFGRTAINPTAVADIRTTGTVFTAITAALSLTLTTYGGALHCGFMGVLGGDPALLCYEVDGTAYSGIHPSGCFKAINGTQFNYTDWITQITASGAHVIRPAWRVGAGTQTGQLLCSGNPAIFWAREG